MSKYEFEVDKICNYLKPLTEQLHDLYQWNAKIDRLEELSVFTKKQIDEISNLSPYDKELKIKKAVNAKLNEAYQLTDKQNFYDLCSWIIKDWGGILTGNDQNTIKLIDEFLATDKPTYNRIASSSKIGSFMRPTDYIIYDSRVAYSLNWILLSETSSNIFFPIPEGRNSKMMAFDMNVLIRLKNIGHYKSQTADERDNRLYINKKDKQFYIPEKEAYTELNGLIRQINDNLWIDDQEKKDNLFYTEMLLFSIADKQIFDDITNRVEIKI